jgi:short-subunit dehydrogenase
MHVIATGRKPEALASLRDEAKGLRLNTVELDVTSAESIAQAKGAVDRITSGYGVDALVNNAGYGMAAPLIETTEQDLRDQYETNVFGLMAVTRAFVPQMMARGSGRLINVSSVGGRITLPFFGAYNSTKYAVESLSDAFRVELAPFGIQTALIEPGPIQSHFSEKSMSYVDKYQNDSSPYAAVYKRAHEIRKESDARAAGPEGVARAIIHAIEARRARPRYVVPFALRLGVWLSAFTPTRVIDAMLGWLVGIGKVDPRAELPPPGGSVRPGASANADMQSASA